MYFKTKAEADIKDFKKICEAQVDLKYYPRAEGQLKNILIYSGDQLRDGLVGERDLLMSEIHHALKNGPGVIVIKKFYPDLEMIDRGTAIFNQIIAEESRQEESRGDHFAKGSPNSRIWEVMGKMLKADPRYFYAYFKNPLFPLAAESWLGPAYRITAQVNLVRPGSPAQVPHRDYHLGFLDDEVVARYPITAQVMSQYLTLQGGIAHGDMPIETGPTMLLPFSQKYQLGYLAMRKPDFIDYFNQHSVQIEFAKGDAVFFSPALFHAAGENRSSDQDRMANLIQISSSFGRPIEKVDLVKISETVYPLLLEEIQALPSPHITAEMEAVIKASAVGYPFPTDLDKMKPKPNSLTPASDQDVMRSHLLKQSSLEEFRFGLAENQI